MFDASVFFGGERLGKFQPFFTFFYLLLDDLKRASKVFFQ
jgi:hypothetical protein